MVTPRMIAELADDEAVSPFTVIDLSTTVKPGKDSVFEEKLLEKSAKLSVGSGITVVATTIDPSVIAVTISFFGLVKPAAANIAFIIWFKFRKALAKFY